MDILWFVLISVMLAIYAILDGFDFGAGALHLIVAKTNEERRSVLGAIGPYWDGNEVWLLAAGGVLFLAFPSVLASGFSGFYLAMFLVVWSLMLRGVAIEIRSHVADELWRNFWDFVFAVSSILMPILLGAALGNVLRGVPIDKSGYFNIPLFTDFSTHSPVGFLDWYSVLLGIFVLATLVGHGSLFLAWRTNDAVHERSQRIAIPIWLVAAALGACSTLATARVNPEMVANLQRAPIAWIGVSTFISGMIVIFWGLWRGRYLLSFLGSSCFILGLLGATAACVFPVMLKSSINVEYSLTAHNASAHTNGLRAALRWWLAGFPIAMGYSIFLFRIHRGKLKPTVDGEGY